MFLATTDADFTDYLVEHFQLPDPTIHVVDPPRASLPTRAVVVGIESVPRAEFDNAVPIRCRKGDMVFEGLLREIYLPEEHQPRGHFIVAVPTSAAQDETLAGLASALCRLIVELLVHGRRPGNPSVGLI